METGNAERYTSSEIYIPTKAFSSIFSFFFSSPFSFPFEYPIAAVHRRKHHLVSRDINL
jgi:hypothetical protein